MNLATATATVTGVAIGTTHISVYDATGQVINVDVNVTASTTYDIYFTKSDSFSGTVNIHYWGGSSSSEWPGVAMTHAYTNNMSQDVVKASIPADTTSILFNNGSGTQTVDITSGVENNKGFYLNGEWEDGKAKVGSWDVGFYTISYNANGGSGSMGNDNAVCDINWGLKANAFTKSGAGIK